VAVSEIKERLGKEVFVRVINEAYVVDFHAVFENAERVVQAAL